MEHATSRRNFLRATLAAALVLFGGTPTFASVPETERHPEGRLNFYNTHSRERLTVNFRTPKGEYDPEALSAINRILRCPSGEVAEMDVRVIEYLNLVDKELGGEHEIHVISGYRSPTYNSHLRQKGGHVARNSFHMKARAIDVAIPSVGLDKLRRTALNLRLGGVGYYPGAGFVHLDSGPFRTW
jgi:uncharacterized protein YcbK (DUF882 family)